VTLTEKCGEQLLVQLQQIHSNAIVFQQLHDPEKRKKRDQKIAFFLCHVTSRLTTENESSMNQQH
jgi:hypothetical protein